MAFESGGNRRIDWKPSHNLVITGSQQVLRNLRGSDVSGSHRNAGDISRSEGSEDAINKVRGLLKRRSPSVMTAAVG